jgi:hypothetical protein
VAVGRTDRRARRVWSKAYGRVISDDEAIEILTNVRRLAEILLRAEEENEGNEHHRVGAGIIPRAEGGVFHRRPASREPRTGTGQRVERRPRVRRGRVGEARCNAKKEKIKAILSHKLDRVCRNMRDAVRRQELEDACGVQLAFVDNQFGPGAAGALSFNVMAAVAQYYSDNLRSEVLKGMDEKVRQGWPTGLAPYGYINVEDKDEPVQLQPEKSRTLIRIFNLYATGGVHVQDTGRRAGA